MATEERVLGPEEETDLPELDESVVTPELIDECSNGKGSDEENEKYYSKESEGGTGNE